MEQLQKERAHSTCNRGLLSQDKYRVVATLKLHLEGAVQVTLLQESKSYMCIAITVPTNNIEGLPCWVESEFHLRVAYLTC